MNVSVKILGIIKILLGKSTIAPVPQKFINNTLNSDMTSIINELSSLIPQLSTFINQFNDVVSTTGINVISDVTGNLSIDVQGNMSDVESDTIRKKIGIIDRLIATRKQEISDLIYKGMNMEKYSFLLNPDYNSQLTDKITEFNRLKILYRH